MADDDDVKQADAADAAGDGDEAPPAAVEGDAAAGKGDDAPAGEPGDGAAADGDPDAVYDVPVEDAGTPTRGWTYARGVTKY